MEMFRLHQEQKGILLGLGWNSRWYKFAGVVWEPGHSQRRHPEHAAGVIPPILIRPHATRLRTHAQTEASMDQHGCRDQQRLRRDEQSDSPSRRLRRSPTGTSRRSRASTLSSPLPIGTCCTTVVSPSAWIRTSPSAAVRVASSTWRPANLSQGDKDLFVSKSLGAAYRGLDHPTSDVDAFFHSIFNGDQAVIDYMQRFLGYCLTGHTKEQVFAIFHGAGSNGKGNPQPNVGCCLGRLLLQHAPGLPFQRRPEGFEEPSQSPLGRVAGEAPRSHGRVVHRRCPRLCPRQGRHGSIGDQLSLHEGEQHCLHAHPQAGPDDKRASEDQRRGYRSTQATHHRSLLQRLQASRRVRCQRPNTPTHRAWLGRQTNIQRVPRAIRDVASQRRGGME